MIISLIHPSRTRPNQAKKTSGKWLHYSSGENEIEYIVSIDESDSEKEKYLSLFQNSFFSCVVRNNTCVVEAANEGAKISTGEILILVSDDFDCPQDWDKKIVNAVSYNHCYVLKTYDGLQRWIVTLPIIDRAYYELCGYLYHPSYKHQFVDTEMTHLADLQGKLIMRNDIVFPHNHFTTGKTTKDALNIKADLTWMQGEEVYLERVRNKFGLNVDVFKVNPEAKNHLAWLKSKLK